MELVKIFWQKEYPIYRVADVMGCDEKTVLRLVIRYSIGTFKRNATRFIPRDEVIRMLTLPTGDCLKYLAHIRQSN